MTKPQMIALIAIGVMIGVIIQPIITQGMTEFGRLFVTGNALLAALLVAVVIWGRFRT